jgi:hypothetical protein
MVRRHEWSIVIGLDHGSLSVTRNQQLLIGYLRVRAIGGASDNLAESPSAHSPRSACIGFTDAARAAGTYAASKLVITITQHAPSTNKQISWPDPVHHAFKQTPGTHGANPSKNDSRRN